MVFCECTADRRRAVRLRGRGPALAGFFIEVSLSLSLTRPCSTSARSTLARHPPAVGQSYAARQAAYDCPKAGGRRAKLERADVLHGRVIDKMSQTSINKPSRAGPRPWPAALSRPSPSTSSSKNVSEKRRARRHHICAKSAPRGIDIFGGRGRCSIRLNADGTTPPVLVRH